MPRKIPYLILAAILLFAGCGNKNDTDAGTETPKSGESNMAMTITSSVFDEGGMIPPRYTCDGEDISPPLAIDGVPEDAVSLALIADDPDAPRGTWVHWVLYNLPPDTRELPEAIPSVETLENRARHGITDFGTPGYGGPCPPGGVHRYFFKLYALDTIFELPGTAPKSSLVAAMEGHILAECQLMGKYQRR